MAGEYNNQQVRENKLNMIRTKKRPTKTRPQTTPRKNINRTKEMNLANCHEKVISVHIWSEALDGTRRLIARTACSPPGVIA